MDHQLFWYFISKRVPKGAQIPKFCILGSRGCSGSQKVGARKIARCHFRMPVLKVRSQFRSQLKNLQGANFFEPKLDDCMYLACSVSCVNGADLFVQMLMSVLYFCFSFRFHHQKQKDLYNLLQ